MNAQMSLGLWINGYSVSPMSSTHFIINFTRVRSGMDSIPWTHYLAVL